MAVMAASLRRHPASQRPSWPAGLNPRAPLCVLLTCLVPALGVKYLPSFAGPYIGYIDNVFQCDPKDYTHDIEMFIRFSHFNPQRRNQLQTVNGNLTFKTVVPVNSLWVNVRMDTRSNNQWKENAFLFPFYGGNGCKEMRKHAPYVHQLLMDITKGHNDFASCTFQAGKYMVKDYPLNFTYPHFPTMPYGHWRMYVKIGTLDDKSTAKACFYVETHIIPKL